MTPVKERGPIESIQTNKDRGSETHWHHYPECCSGVTSKHSQLLIRCNPTPLPPNPKPPPSPNPLEQHNGIIITTPHRKTQLITPSLSTNWPVSSTRKKVTALFYFESPTVIFSGVFSCLSAEEPVFVLAKHEYTFQQILVKEKIIILINKIFSLINKLD